MMKKTYETPETEVVRVELESPICGGSVDMTATTPGGAGIDDQVVNTEFGSANTFEENASWDPKTNS